jgi:hypothetical protein
MFQGGVILPSQLVGWESVMRTAVEPVPISDIYADDIDHFEILGENVRIYFYTWEDGERVIVAKIVRPLSTFNTLFAARLRDAQAEYQARLRDRMPMVAVN